jgi:nitrous oxide reductase accessory protein NosL
MKPITVSLLAAAALIAGCSKPQDKAPAAPQPVVAPASAEVPNAHADGNGIAWQYAANDAAVDAAFAQASDPRRLRLPDFPQARELFGQFSDRRHVFER